MAGQIVPRGERTWLVRVYLGRDPRTAKRLYDNQTIHGTKKDAQTYLNGALRDRDLGIFTDRSKTLIGVLLDGLLADYETNGKSFPWAETVVRIHLRPFFGAMKATALGTDQVNAYIETRRKSGRRAVTSKGTRPVPPAANATINRELALLRRSFNLAKKATPPKVTSVPSIPVLKENNARKGFFEDKAFLAIRGKLPEEIQVVVTFAYYTGCRKGEILGLRWSQIDLAERLVRLEPGETKNDEGRTIFLAPELHVALTAQKTIRDEFFPECDWVFSRAGRQIRDFRGAWAAACKGADLVRENGAPDKLFHDLRRTGVRNLVRAGVPERVAMMISGHKTRDVFDRYNIVSEADLKDAARRLGEFIGR